MSPVADPGRRDWRSRLITPLAIVGVVVLLHFTGLADWMMDRPAVNGTVLAILVLYFGFITLALLFLARQEAGTPRYWFYLAYGLAMTFFCAALLFGAI